MNGRSSRTRMLIAREAARLMYEEQVDQYFTAKRMAAKRLFGASGGRRLHFRPADLPANGEIQEALLQLADLAEGQARTERLGDMRLRALEVMRALSPFEPRLIGSVSTGHIRQGSDIDIHLFSDDPDESERHVQELGWAYERRDVQIRRPGGWCEYVHLCIDDQYPIELTLYPRAELRNRPRSSTDGKPIERLKVTALEALIRREHPRLSVPTLAPPDHVHL